MMLLHIEEWCQLQGGEESQYFMPLSIGWLLGLTKLRVCSCTPKYLKYLKYQLQGELVVRVDKVERNVFSSAMYIFVLQNIKMFPNDKITTR